MGVSFTWQPTYPDKGHSFASGSLLNTALTNAFGEFPIKLTALDIGKLEGIIACGFDDMSEVLEALNHYKEIEIKDHW